MKLSEAIDAVLGHPQGRYWFRPRDWDGSGGAFALNAESGRVTQMLGSKPMVEGMNPEMPEVMLEWELVEPQQVQQEDTAPNETELENIPRSLIEQTARSMGKDSAASKALKRGDWLVRQGEKVIYALEGGQLVVKTEQQAV